MVRTASWRSRIDSIQAAAKWPNLQVLCGILPVDIHSNNVHIRAPPSPKSFYEATYPLGSPWVNEQPSTMAQSR